MATSGSDDRTVINPNAGVRQRAPGDAVTGNALPVGTMLGEFELQKVAGEGGFSIVYLAWDHSLQRRVALKEYLPSSLSMRAGGSLVRIKSERHRQTFELGLKSFINEARLLARFDHPSLVKVYRFWEDNGTAYMVMPFYEGQTLRDALRERRAPPDETWLRNLLLPLTEALLVIHAEQCYHRDIAADNVILLAGGNRPLLLDFGAARRVIGDMTHQLTAILKPGYAPIEQYAEDPAMKQGPWTDVYALGALLYGAILGKIPPAAVARMVSDTMVPIRQAAYGRYSDGFLHAIDRALIVRPDERIQDITAFRQELGLTERLVEAERAPPPPVEVPTVLIPRPGSPAPAPSFRRDTPEARGPAGVARAPSLVPAAAPSRLGPMLVAGGGVLLLAAAGAAAYWALSTKPAPATGPVADAPAASAAAVTVPAPAAVTAQPSAPVTAPAAATVNAAPAPPPVPSTAYRPSGPFDPKREFEQILKARTPGFDVEARSTKPTLRIDKDQLSFSVKSSRDGYVYVLQLGADANVRELFPNKGATNNRILKDQTLALPRPDWMFALDTGEPAGREYVLAIVSATPRDFKAMGSLSEGGFPLFPIGEQAAALPRPGGVSPYAGKPVCSAGVACRDEYGAAIFSYDVVR